MQYLVWMNFGYLINDIMTQDQLLAWIWISSQWVNPFQKKKSLKVRFKILKKFEGLRWLSLNRGCVKLYDQSCCSIKWPEFMVGPHLFYLLCCCFVFFFSPHATSSLCIATSCLHTIVMPSCHVIRICTFPSFQIL